MNQTPIFITGTDTDIGKTWVSAYLAHHFNRPYHKVIQTGLNSDYGVDREVLSSYGITCLKEQEQFLAPLSPYEASLLENRTVDITDLKCPQGPYILEGAGGLLVPITQNEMMIDLIKRWEVPAILVSQDRLGSLNHTLLSLEALRARDIHVLGFIMISKSLDQRRSEIIERVSGIRCLQILPYVKSIDELLLVEPSVALRQCFE